MPRCVESAYATLISLTDQPLRDLDETGRTSAEIETRDVARRCFPSLQVEPVLLV